MESFSARTGKLTCPRVDKPASRAVNVSACLLVSALDGPSRGEKGERESLDDARHLMHDDERRLLARLDQRIIDLRTELEAMQELKD